MARPGEDAPHYRRILSVLLLAGALILSTAVLIEIAGQLYVSWFVRPAFEQAREHEGHYYRRSMDPSLAYELRPGYERQVNGRDLKINSIGFRGDEVDHRNKPYRLALIGDSVTFGIGLPQDRTISAILEATAPCENIAVLNFGVPGYGVQEVEAQLRSMYQSVFFDAVVYVLNLNDFTLRDTVYEGADNGLYRMYEMPIFKTPWILRKSWYRLMKGDGIATSAMQADAGWYRWLFDGTKAANLDRIRAMKRFANERGIQFGVFVLPAGSAYSGSSYALQDLHDEILSRLAEFDIPVRDGVAVFESAPEVFFDATDHLTDRGNVEAAAAIAEFLQAEVSGRLACGAVKAAR